MLVHVKISIFVSWKFYKNLKRENSNRQKTISLFSKIYVKFLTKVIYIQHYGNVIIRGHS